MSMGWLGQASKHGLNHPASGYDAHVDYYFPGTKILVGRKVRFARVCQSSMEGVSHLRPDSYEGKRVFV